MEVISLFIMVLFVNNIMTYLSIRIRHKENRAILGEIYYER